MDIGIESCTLYVEVSDLTQITKAKIVQLNEME